jgi:hypothetical protein
MIMAAINGFKIIVAPFQNATPGKKLRCEI